MITRAYARKEAEPRVKPKNASTKILGFGISMVGIVILSIALIMGLEFPSFVHDRVVHDICVAGQDHKFYTKWRLEEDWVRYNKLYYWVIENPNGFLFHGQPPLFMERGPYVYKEKRQKLNPVFHGPTVTFQYGISQTFDETLTKRECGIHCDENDQLYVFNLDYLKQVASLNSLDNLIYNKMPDVVKDVLQNTSITQTGGRSAVLAFLGCLSSVCEDQTSNNISNKQLLYNVSIGVFIQQNDNWYKERILQHRSGQSFTELEMLYFYNLIENHDVMGVSESKLTNTNNVACESFAVKHLCNSSDIEASSYNNISTNEIADFITFHQSCGLIYILIAVADVGCLSNVTSELVGYINDVTGVSWLNLTMNEHLTILPQAYLLLLKDFILVKVFNFVYSKIFFDNYPSIIQKRHQRQIALGYINEGLYVHENNSYNVYRPTWQLSTCLENRHRDNNMVVREFNGSQYAPQSVFSEGSNRPVYSGATRYVPMPSRYVTCESLLPQRQSYSIFVEDLYRDVTFSKPVKTTLYSTTLFEYSLDKEFYSRSLRDNNSCMIQVMDDIYKFPSVISNPRFLGCDKDKHYLFNLSPSTENHISKIGIEPRTGNIWSQNIRLQTNTYLNINHVKTRNHALFNITNMTKIFPVYWIDRTAQTSPAEAQYYNEKVGKLLDTSCGGLIGFSIVAIFVVIISVFVAFVPRGRNKVAPAPVTEDTHAIYASPLTC